MTLILGAMLIGASAKADVTLVGVFTKKAVISIDGSSPQSLGIGEERKGVKLVSIQGETATLLIDGESRTLRVGQNGRNVAPTRKQRLREKMASEVTLHADAQGRFKTDGEINGASVRFLLDNNASTVILDQEEARRLNLKLSQADVGEVEKKPGGGKTPVRFLKLETVKVGNIVVHNVDCMVHTAEDLPIAILGMSYLGQVKQDRKVGTLTLSPGVPGYYPPGREWAGDDEWRARQADTPRRYVPPRWRPRSRQQQQQRSTTPNHSGVTVIGE